jgi:hypothetical protein
VNNYERSPTTNDSWTIVDTLGPTSQVRAMPAYSINFMLVVTADASDLNNIARTELWYRKDEGIWTKYGDGSSLPMSWNFDTSRTGGDGTYRFYSKAWDLAGNFEQVQGTEDAMIIVDTIKPLIAIEGPVEGFKTTSTRMMVNWTGNDSTSGIDHFEIEMDGGVPINVSFQTNHVFEKLSLGIHVVTVTAFDRAGNLAETSLTFNVVKEPQTTERAEFPFLIPLIIVVAILAAVLVLWAMKRKRGPVEGPLAHAYTYQLDQSLYVDSYDPPKTPPGI